MYTHIFLSKHTSSGFAAVGIDMDTDVNIGIAICRGSKPINTEETGCRTKRKHERIQIR